MNKVWFFGVGGASAEGRCEDVVLQELIVSMQVCVCNHGIDELQSNFGFWKRHWVFTVSGIVQATIPVMYNWCLGVYWSDGECEVA